MQLREVVVIHEYYNFTKFHQNRMKNKKVLLIACFFVQNFKVPVELWKSYIVQLGQSFRIKIKKNIRSISKALNARYECVTSGDARKIFYLSLSLRKSAKRILQHGSTTQGSKICTKSKSKTHFTKKNLKFDDSICNVKISWSNNYTQMHIFAFEIEPFLEF